jgi:hypothetical protein
MQSVLITKSTPGHALLEGEMYPLDQVARELQLDLETLQSRLDAGETVEANGVVVAPLLDEEGRQPDF